MPASKNIKTGKTKLPFRLKKTLKQCQMLATSIPPIHIASLQFLAVEQLQYILVPWHFKGKAFCLPTWIVEVRQKKSTYKYVNKCDRTITGNRNDGRNQNMFDCVLFRLNNLCFVIICRQFFFGNNVIGMLLLVRLKAPLCYVLVTGDLV